MPQYKLACSFKINHIVSALGYPDNNMQSKMMKKNHFFSYSAFLSSGFKYSHAFSIFPFSDKATLIR